MTFSVQVFAPGTYAREAAERIASRIPSAGAVVLTGGTTAAGLYGALADEEVDWSRVEAFFSDERCVPPDDPASNFAMVSRLLLERRAPREAHRMHGEDDPGRAADDYHRAIGPAVERGFDLLLLGMGADCHVAGLFPGSPALHETSRLCRPVDRPDGMKGLTLTPPALSSARAVLLLVAGETKAEAVARALRGREPVERCPARLLAGHRDATFLLDEDAAADL